MSTSATRLSANTIAASTTVSPITIGKSRTRAASRNAREAAGHAEVLLDEERAGDQERQHRHDGREHGHERVAQHVHEHDPVAPQPLRARRAHEVLAERLDDRGAHEPGDVAGRRERQRQHGHDAGVPAVPAEREPVPLERGVARQHPGDEEDGDDEQERRDGGGGAVRRRPAPQGAEQAERRAPPGSTRARRGGRAAPSRAGSARSPRRRSGHAGSARGRSRTWRRCARSARTRRTTDPRGGSTRAAPARAAAARPRSPREARRGRRPSRA